MDDFDGPIVAETVYQELLKTDNFDLEAVPYAVDTAVQRLRAAGVPPERWGPYIHMGA
jgi:hypothetical protein